MRNPYLIDWAITNRCNLNCLHCRGMAPQELDGGKVIDVAHQISSLNPGWVIIEGGEPLLRQELFEVIEIIRKGDIKVYLISNGMFLDENIAKRLAEFDVSLMISIDGADKESYEGVRKGASFEKLKQAVAIANEHKILDSCPVAIGRHNYGQIGEIFKFAKGTGYKKITFLGLKPCMDYKKYVLNGEQYKDIFLSVVKYQKEFMMDVYFDEPFFKPFLREHGIDYSAGGENGIVVPDTSSCIFGSYMFIETNGDVKPCTFAARTMGNVNEKNLDEIWNDIQNSELIKKITDFSTREGECRRCKYLYQCGGCRSRVFNLTGSWFASDPSCPLRREI
ncbi:putative mycofactocin radical SAM maturase MftC [subsurface metagenome]